ncbi:uncharacterized protein LOC119990810 [Tripterygium wilfordii]|uniref:uncharacterized protein LOC119990810 n=1 Tax=Tripterygium wilfordii TaxID=458696 RepID=UPI0018F844FB|nr:uncharacterized protein LOC119990810 [Tripterygium wilfordii]
MSSSGFSSSFLFLLLLLFLANVFSHSEASIAQANGSLVEAEELVPLLGQKKVEMVLNGSRRKLGGFQICALCTCCGGSRGVCVPSPCCYAINCNIPNRPYGFCSFTPKTCNCFGCHI